MTGTSTGIAHVSFAGGGLFLPALTRYDRQMLIEHVVNRVRAERRVQVLIGDERWMVHAQHVHTRRCAQCGRSAAPACYEIQTNRAPYCLRCAFLLPCEEGTTSAVPSGTARVSDELLVDPLRIDHAISQRAR